MFPDGNISFHSLQELRNLSTDTCRMTFIHIYITDNFHFSTNNRNNVNQRINVMRNIRNVLTSSLLKKEKRGLFKEQSPNSHFRFSGYGLPFLLLVVHIV